MLWSCPPLAVPRVLLPADCGPRIGASALRGHGFQRRPCRQTVSLKSCRCRRTFCVPDGAHLPALPAMTAAPVVLPTPSRAPLAGASGKGLCGTDSWMRVQPAGSSWEPCTRRPSPHTALSGGSAGLCLHFEAGFCHLQPKKVPNSSNSFSEQSR